MPRRSAGALVSALRLRPGEERPSGGRVYRHLRDAIMRGTLAPGERLPSTRALAGDWGVSRTLTEDAYAQLEAEGLVARRHGSGTYVSAALDALRPTTPVATQSSSRRVEVDLPPRLSARGRRLSKYGACREPESLRPFNAGVADAAAFPWETWERALRRARRSAGAAALRFSDPRGWRPLREAIARHLQVFRGVRCTADQVLVFNSSQQVLVAAALLLLEPRDAAWVENPAYPGAVAAFELAGTRIVPVPVDCEGIDVAAGRRMAPKARLAYITPSHQYPRGVTLGLRRRIELLTWAREVNAWIVEDDYDGEFRYAGRPLTAIQGFEGGERVIYVGTLSKAMFPSLRVAYAVVAEPLVDAFAVLRTQFDGFTPGPVQAALACFIDEGHFAAHVRRMRSHYAGKRARLLELLEPAVRHGWQPDSEEAGFHLCIRPPDERALRRAVELAPAAGLEIAALSDYALAPLASDGLFVRYAGLGEAALVAGGTKLGRLLAGV